MGEETASGTGILNPRRDAISRMLKYMDVNPDVVFVVSNSPTHKRASAYPATDDTTRKGVQTSYQGSPFIHYHWHSVPGMAAIHATESTALTGAHEFAMLFQLPQRLHYRLVRRRQRCLQSEGGAAGARLVRGVRRQ